MSIVVRGLEKWYGDVHAVRGVDLDVAPGEVFGLLGPNGAGKSTLIAVLCTLSTPSAGSASIRGNDVLTARAAVRRDIGLVFQETSLDEHLTARRNLIFHGELYGVPPAALPARIERLLRLVGLWERRDDLVRTFSGGMKRRLELARGVLHEPRVLFLDEPTIGLDPQSRGDVWGYLDELRRQSDTTIFFTTHSMEEAERCDRVAIMVDGKIVADGAPEVLKAEVGGDRVRLRTDDDGAALTALRTTFGVDAQIHDGVITFGVPSAEGLLPRLFSSELPVSVRSINVATPSLEDVFLSLVGTTMGDAERRAPARR